LRHFSVGGLERFRRGVEKASKVRRKQADDWALSLAPVVNDIFKEGFGGFDLLARELAVRGCKTRRGGKWRVDTARKLFHRLVALGLLDGTILTRRGYPLHPHEARRESVDRVRQAFRDHADAFARTLAPILSSLRAHGSRTHASLADALNTRGIAPQRVERWTQASVRHLCNRLREMADRDAGTSEP